MGRRIRIIRECAKTTHDRNFLHGAFKVLVFLCRARASATPPGRVPYHAGSGSNVRIVLGNSNIATYPEGGGHWSWFLQYPLGLKALGEDVLWLELLASSGDRARDLRLIQDFFERLA